MSEPLPEVELTPDQLAKACDVFDMMRGAPITWAMPAARLIVYLQDDVSRLQTRIAELERGEYICKSCGLRKDGEVDDQPNF